MPACRAVQAEGRGAGGLVIAVIDAPRIVEESSGISGAGMTHPAIRRLGPLRGRGLTNPLTTWTPCPLTNM